MKISKSNRKKLRSWHIILILVGIIAGGTLIAFLADAPERQKLKTMTIEDVDFTNLRDGIYAGEYSKSKNKSRNTAVEATISGGKITDIRILKGALDRDGRPAELTQGMTIADLFQNVIQSQSLQVDTISGATLTSKAHLKALESALKQGLEE